MRTDYGPTNESPGGFGRRALFFSRFFNSTNHHTKLAEAQVSRGVSQRGDTFSTNHSEKV